VHSAQLDELEDQGEEVHENRFVARVPAQSRAAVGQSMQLALDTAKIAVFDAASGANLTIPPE
jgi:multiple sugar transport system ATP-binding protein